MFSLGSKYASVVGVSSTCSMDSLLCHHLRSGDLGPCCVKHV